jgi:hypothetical protein
MYSKIQEQKSDYFITHGNVLITSNINQNNVPELIKYDFDQPQNGWNTAIKNSSGLICYFDNFLLIQDYEGIVSLINNEDGKVLKEFSSQEFKISLPIYTNQLFNSKLNCYKGRIFERQFGLYDFIKDEIIWGGAKMDGFWIDGFYIIKSENDIIVNPYSEKFKWHFTLQSLKESHPEKVEKYGDYPMTINNFVGIANGVLWMDIDVAMNGSFLLGLDCETGLPTHLLDFAENQNEVDYVALVPNRLPGASYTTYDSKRNILLGFKHDYFHWQVDLSSTNPCIKMWSLQEEMTKHHAYVSAYMNCGISDSHVFFPVGSLGSTPQVFALNRETLKVDWQYFFTEGGQYFTPTKVEVTETHLYVLDNTGTLHIFEKTENA